MHPIQAAFHAQADVLETAGPFRGPAERVGEENRWSVEALMGHVVVSGHILEQLIEEVMAGTGDHMDAGICDDEMAMESVTADCGGLDRVGDAIRATGDRLALLCATLPPEQAATSVHVRIVKYGQVVMDAREPLGLLIDHGAGHIQAHVADLAALAR